jgi:hypothetical protein
MPKCIVCNSILPPEFLDDTPDGLAKKCLFCTKGSDSIEYFSESEQRTLKTTKAETVKEYQELLKELSEIPNVKDILDVIKERGNSHILT